MKTKLVPSCDPSVYSDLSTGEQLVLQLKWSIDPVAFFESPQGGNMALWDSQKEILKDFYGIDKKTKKRTKSELVFMAGRRGGKSTMAALISLYEAARLLMMKNPQEFYKLSPNAEIFCLNVAPSEPQALDTVFKREKEILANSPFFCSFKPDLTYNTVRFPKNITIKALGSSIASGVGRTVKCFVADEVSSFKDTERHSPEELYIKLGNSTGTFKKWNENIRVAISSKTTTGDFISNLYKQATEEKWPWAICVAKRTSELNPNMDADTLEEERRRNPELFALEYELEDLDDIKSFFNAYKLEEVIIKNSLKTNLFMGEPPVKRIERKFGFTPELDKNKLNIRLYPNAVDFYVLADPAVTGDAFGLSVGYLDINGDIVIIGSTAFIAPKGGQITEEDLKKIIEPIFQSLSIRAYIFDAHLHSGIQSLARSYNIEVIQHTLNLNDWILTRNDLYENRARIPYMDLLIKEYRELQLIRNTKVDHLSNGSKDVADTTCQLISHIRREEEELRNQQTAPMVHHMATF